VNFHRREDVKPYMPSPFTIINWV